MSTGLHHLYCLLIGGWLCLNNSATAHGHKLTEWTQTDDSKFVCPGDDVIDLHLVINALGFVDATDTAIWRRLEVIWNVNAVNTDDEISIFDSDPNETPTLAPLLSFRPSESSEPYRTTNLTVPVFNFTDGEPTTQCLGFYATYSRQEVAVATTCLRQRPDWMESLEADLRMRYLDEVMLPGAHDSTAYETYKGRKTDENLVVRYASAQEESLLAQFYMGVRHFDTRVAYYPDWEDPFWAVHSFVPFRPYKVVIDDVVTMMQKTKEIVVYEIGGFDGSFSSHPEAYEQLLSILIPRLERWLVPVPDDVSKRLLLSDLWAADQRLVLSWDGPVGNHSSILWPRLPSSWNNDNTPEELYETLANYINSAPRGTLWALSGEMTDHVSDIVFDRWESLRHMADTVNRNISRMVLYDWWDKTNIVLSDFFASSYHVDTAVLVNWQRVHC